MARLRFPPAVLTAIALSLAAASTGAGPIRAAEPARPPAVQGSKPSPADPGRAPVAVGIEIAVEDGRTRVSLALSRPVEATAFLLTRPDRVVVELPRVNCQLAPEATRRRAGLVAGMRCGLFAPGRTRLVVDLAAPALIGRLGTLEGAIDGGSTLVLELAPADREAFRRAVRVPGATDPETTGSLAPGTSLRRPVVAIDAGHGGADSGAVAIGGEHEKDVVLAFAQALRDRLAETGRVETVMTRDSDVFVPLDERVRLAHAAGADLFVSVHGDSIGSASVRGATIYTGAERPTDLDAARLAERENAADAAAGIVAPDAVAGVTDILGELTLRETRGLSHRVSGLLHETMAPVTRFSAQPRRAAAFRVLRSADMTSVLVELGYLSNAADADLLLSGDWRRRNAAAMASAIERFFAFRAVARAAVSP